jgi:crotonobetainyl-CoA:carnitine CoA-transferase CaiB-like acyl-CoA transferase
MILGDLGAEVIKIESPGGSPERATAGPNHKGESFHFLHSNRNKKSVELDILTETGRQAFYDLVKISDVVWENFRPGAMERMHVDYDTLKRVNPRIIYCSLTGYGSSGPYRDRQSFDPIGLGMSGFLSVTGEPGRTPVRPGPSLGDLIPATFASLGVVAALLRRELTGEGQRVEVAQLDACFAFMVPQVCRYFLSGEVAKPLGGGHPGSIPYGVYPTKEGYIVVGPSWPRICRVLGLEHLIDDPRFATHAARLQHRDELEPMIVEAFRKEKAEDWLEALYLEDIGAGPVNTIDKAANDPQLLHNNMVLALEHPLGGEVKLQGNPIKMPCINGDKYTAPPTLGQHTHEILSGLLGYSEEKLRMLKEEQEKHRDELETHIRKIA